MFYKRDIILDTTRFDPYTGNSGVPSFTLFVVQGEDNCASLDALSKGDLVELTYFIKGVKYERDGDEKFFNELICFKHDVIEKSGGVTAKEHPFMPPLPTTDDVEPPEVDDLPF